MGLIQAMLTLANPKDKTIQPIEAEAMVDTGSVYLVIPEHVSVQLKLDEYTKKEVVLADGSHRAVSYVGPVEVRFKNRVALVGAIVMGQEVLLGAIPMEDMDLVLLPALRRADINPANPNLACGMAK